MEVDDYRNYLMDLCFEIKEAAVNAGNAFRRNDSDHNCGSYEAYRTVVYLIKSKAEMMEIPLDDILMADFNPDKDL